MTNIQSKTAQIKIRFEINDQHYFVIRNLKKWKSRDSCQSVLSSMQIDIMNIQDELPKSGIHTDMDIQQFIEKHAQLENIVFKNESDLQHNLTELLPPREVFMSTIFLLQDAENIFELQPIERLNVLKNVFGLLGIDDAKEKISDKKREIVTELKVKSDTTGYNIRLHRSLQNYIQSFDLLLENKETKEFCQPYAEHIQEIKNLADKLSISEFAIDEFSWKLTTLN